MKDREQRFNPFKKIAAIDYTIGEGIGQDYKANVIAESAGFIGIVTGVRKLFIDQNETDAAICFAAAAWLFSIIGTNAYFKGRQVISNRNSQNYNRKPPVA
jgi:hypothetical protein